MKTTSTKNEKWRRPQKKWKKWRRPKKKWKKMKTTLKKMGKKWLWHNSKLTYFHLIVNHSYKYHAVGDNCELECCLVEDTFREGFNTFSLSNFSGLFHEKNGP